ncbi:MAG: CDP-alcohol phosphatidyltransferase family protein [Phycisphaerales bacterium]
MTSQHPHQEPPSTARVARPGRVRLRRRGDRRPLPGVKVLPTLTTLGNLLCGFGAIYYSARTGEAAAGTPFGWSTLTIAGALVFLGMFFDAVDGSVARLTRSTSDLGAQLDSLADMVTFGVAPAFMMLRLISQYYGRGEVILGPDAGTWYAKAIWSIAAVYVCCTALRLARFNAETSSASEKDHRWFKGLPSPGAGGAVAALILLHQHMALVEFAEKGEPASFAPISALAIPAVTLLCALAMVSRMRYPHFVNRYLKGRKSFGSVAFLVVVLAAGAWWFHYVLAGALVIYALSGPFVSLFQPRTAAPPHSGAAGPAA